MFTANRLSHFSRIIGSNANLMRQMNKRSFSFSWPCPRVLREIVKMSAFDKENAETCEYIWNEYHHAKPTTVSTTLNSRMYRELVSKGK